MDALGQGRQDRPPSDDLPEPDDSGWRARNLLGELQLIHYRLLAALTHFAVADGGSVEQGWLTTFGSAAHTGLVALAHPGRQRPPTTRSLAYRGLNVVPFSSQAGGRPSRSSAIASDEGDEADEHDNADEQQDQEGATATSLVLELAETYREAVADAFVRRGTSSSGDNGVEQDGRI